MFEQIRNRRPQKVRTLPVNDIAGLSGTRSRSPENRPQSFAWSLGRPQRPDTTLLATHADRRLVDSSSKRLDQGLAMKLDGPPFCLAAHSGFTKIFRLITSGDLLLAATVLLSTTEGFILFSHLEDHGLPLVQLKEQRRDLGRTDGTPTIRFEPHNYANRSNSADHSGYRSGDHRSGCRTSRR
jgi:hypothetical protein